MKRICKRGDWAVVVAIIHRSEAENLGKIVRCKGHTKHPLTGEPAWTLFHPVNSLGHDRILDRLLRPIRADGVTDSEVRKLFEPGPAIKQTEAV